MSGDAIFKLFAFISLKSGKCFSPSANIRFSSSEYSTPLCAMIISTFRALVAPSISRLLSNCFLIVQRYISWSTAHLFTTDLGMSPPRSICCMYVTLV